MPTTRTPISRPPNFTIPPEAVDLFRRMLDLPACTCDVLKSNDECASCERWSRLHKELHDDVLKLPPWCWPAVVNPDERCVWPPGSGGAEWHPQAQALWRALERMVNQQSEDAR